MGIVVEVGANEGQHTGKFLEAGHQVFAFEPIPHHAKLLWDRHGKNPNFFLSTIAIDIRNGYRRFNISQSTDWGCSSFYEFKKDVNQKWPGRDHDFRYTDYVANAMCMRLDTFMDIYGIPGIDYLHVDAQGNDFLVMQSLGERIKNVDAGVVEAAQKVELYEVEGNTVENVRPWLISHGFEVTVVDDGVGREHEGATVNGNEANLYFRRPGI